MKKKKKAKTTKPAKQLRIDETISRRAPPDNPDVEEISDTESCDDVDADMDAYRTANDIIQDKSTVVENDTEFAHDDDDDDVECGLCHLHDDEMDKNMGINWVQCERETCLHWFHVLCVELYWPDKPISDENEEWFCC